MVSKSVSDVSTSKGKDEVHSWFGVRTCQSLLETLLTLDDIDVDILVLLRDEVIVLQRMLNTLRSISSWSSSLTKFVSSLLNSRCSRNPTVLSTL